MLAEGERWAHVPARARWWLVAMPPVLRALGLHAAAHSSRLMPLLLRWLHLPDARVAALALRALGCVIRGTWPRVPAHACVIRRHLAQLYRVEAPPGSRLLPPTPKPSTPPSAGAADGQASGSDGDVCSHGSDGWPGTLDACPGDGELLLRVKEVGRLLEGACTLALRGDQQRWQGQQQHQGQEKQHAPQCAS